MRFFDGLILSGLLSVSWVEASANAPRLDINNINQLKAATRMAMKNLMSYYTPNSQGIFNEKQMPWHESGMVWDLNFDYAKWTGDTQFLNTVTQALVHQSRDDAHDFLGPGEQVEGQWNDDIMWPALVPAAAAEFYGAGAKIPGSQTTWIKLAEKTYREAGSQMDNKCGGGIYWYRDRKSPKGTFKSLITELEFIALGARNYLINRDSRTLRQAKVVLNWVISSGLGNTRTGVLFDGVDVKDCSHLKGEQWTYNYGQLLGALSGLHKATGDQRYLNIATPFFDYSRRTFAASNTSGIITEPCEPSRTCNRDQQGFKAIYARNLAYLYRETNNQKVKTGIRNMILTSVKAMVTRSCDKYYNCGGNWTMDTHPVRYVRSQHVSTALLVAAVGIHEASGAKRTRPFHPLTLKVAAKPY
ncbi:uncharacterized protein PGTG_03481 [Puccinia graminis f. sp. tritici CRL 75-36-700-3]|uniref:Mannan endo-1,6-alpha-mannosidase n=1 Tax=Puccinia graminis f. sp. tritici (strain CRL 75-36-700-3 / race SCCL) TaxID=418459 RepID=E3JZQ0_PUCGT|nr:uncharacterized protein PGTG_03481 [Puccinia graminis f. sp. tritici CRL 75-36-700-3]EFP77525.2 hypothetical protein PGTG_03481 [Puccinia graminis f. sp. tritici CRL 75-36-700-3]